MKTLKEINNRSWYAIFYFALATIFFIGAFAPDYVFSKIMLRIVCLQNSELSENIVRSKEFLNTPYLSFDSFGTTPEMSGWPTVVFFISGILYLMHVRLIFYFRNKYRMLIENKGVEKNGQAICIADFSYIRGIVTALVPFLGIWGVYDWGAIREAMPENHPLTLILWLIALVWILIHLMVSIGNRTNGLFVDKTVIVDMHQMFPELVASGRMVVPFHEMPRYKEVSYSFPKEEEPGNWDQQVRDGFQRFKESQLREWEKR